MKYPKGNNCHQCAPKDWHHTPNLTGDYEMDASIMHAKAKRLNSDLIHHIKGGGYSILDPDETAYGYRTNYRGYRGYHGDD